MPDRGHFQRLRPVIADLARRGARVVAFTHRDLAGEVRQAGGEFVDLLAGRSIDQPGDDSWPPVCRYTTFASVYAEEIRDEVARLGASLVVHDTFAVIGHVVGRLLRLPLVNVCAGHNVAPARFLEVLRTHPRVRPSEVCLQAADRLRVEFGLTDITPFSYVTSLSRELNVYCEPPAFLPDEDRPVFDPVAFYGSLAPEAVEPRTEGEAERAAARWFGAGSRGLLKVYVSFGTAIWMSRTAEALAALGAVADWAEGRQGVRVLVGLGGSGVPDADRQRLTRQNVMVADYVDQWDVLGGADVFVTHHGLNSTHEAIASLVPMVSYPFVWDQPGLAGTCQRLGVAVPLVESTMAPVAPADVGAAIHAVLEGRERLSERLVLARDWERAVIAGRPAVVDRIIDLGRRAG